MQCLISQSQVLSFIYTLFKCIRNSDINTARPIDKQMDYQKLLLAKDWFQIIYIKHKNITQKAKYLIYFQFLP